MMKLSSSSESIVVKQSRPRNVQPVIWVMVDIKLKYDLGRICVLQPDLIEQKEISSLIQIHFKL